MSKRHTAPTRRTFCLAVVAAFCALAVSGSVRAADEGPALPIIPGAHGFGMETPAGSGRHLPVPKTTVYKVTTLADSGPGSLREALKAKGPRTIVFEVSGYIDLKSSLGVGSPYVTVAGQTAPWPGIVIRWYEFSVRANDVLIQHIGFRTGDRIAGRYMPHRGCLDITGARNVVVDHCSTGWAHQCGLSLSGQNMTARHCLMSEGWWNAGHNEDQHAKGAFINVRRLKMEQANAIVGSLFAHNEGRNPDVMMGSRAVIANNVMYNYAGVGVKMMNGARDPKKPCVVSIMGNAFIPGCDTGGDPQRPHRGKAAWIYLDHDKSRIFLSPDNLMPDGKTHDDPWAQINARRHMGDPESKPNPGSIASKPAVSIPGYTVKPAAETEAWVLANAGPFPARRNPIDARIIYELRTRTGRGRDDQEDAGGWPEMPENHRRLDIPKNPNGDDDGDGYTNLEEWLHGFADVVEGRKGPIPGTDQDLGKREAERCTMRTPPDLDQFRKIRDTKDDWTFDVEEAKRRQQQAAKDAGLPVTRSIDLGDGVTIDLRLIPAGEFRMGSKYPPQFTKGRATHGVNVYRREYPARRVKLTKPYYMGTYEVTQAVWEKVMRAKWSFKRNQVTPDLRGEVNRGRQKPVLLLTGFKPKKDKHPEYYEVFLTKLNETVGKATGLTFRLPTEAEWEYACRAGTDTPFWFGESISPKQANYNKAPWRAEPILPPYQRRGKRQKPRPRGTTMPVGRFAPNPWGLYDTVGNASELVLDPWGPYPEGDLLLDPLARHRHGPRTVRGGAANSYPEECRSAYGTYLAVYGGRERAGLRLVAVSAERD